MRAIALLISMLVCGVLADSARAQTVATGGAEYGAQPAAAPPGGVQPGQPETAPVPGSPNPVVPGTMAVLLPDGSAAAPADAPAEVQKAIWAANSLQSKPYRYGGGHGSFTDSGYDCSGTVSFALNAAGLLDRPLDSGSFMRWGEGGRGAWVTVYTNPGHAYVVVAGLRLDTSAAYAGRTTSRRGRTPKLVSAKATERGPRWRPSSRSSRGFTARHPAGL